MSTSTTATAPTSASAAPSTGAASIETMASRAQLFYYLSKSADDAYHAELAREFGAAEAGDARYDRARNASTPVLALLLAATRACNDARWVASTELAHTAGQYAARDSAAADAAYRLACSGGDSLADVLALAAPARA